MSGATGPEYFEDFLVCPSNQDAVAAARAVAETAPDAPNPLVILGAPADGKTHLVRSLVAAYRRQHPEARAMVMSTERLERSLRCTRLQETLQQLRAGIARIGLLVIEDVQFLDDCEIWRPLLRRVVRHIYAGGGFVVMTRDVPPAAGRVGLPASKVVRLHAPDVALRAAVAKRAAASIGLAIPDDVVQLIAEQCDNLRQVQGAVMRVHATADLIRRDLRRAFVSGCSYAQ